MKKSDLKTGMRAKTRNGKTYLVLKNVDTEKYGNQEYFFSNIENGLFNTGGNYFEDLTHKEDKQYDIIEIFTPDNYPYIAYNILNFSRMYSIWKREEAKEMTLSEICKALGYEVKIVKEEE